MPRQRVALVLLAVRLSVGTHPHVFLAFSVEISCPTKRYFSRRQTWTIAAAAAAAAAAAEADVKRTALLYTAIVLKLI